MESDAAARGGGGRGGGGRGYAYDDSTFSSSFSFFLSSPMPHFKA